MIFIFTTMRSHGNQLNIRRSVFECFLSFWHWYDTIYFKLIFKELLWNNTIFFKLISTKFFKVPVVIEPTGCYQIHSSYSHQKDYRYLDNLNVKSLTSHLDSKMANTNIRKQTAMLPDNYKWWEKGILTNVTYLWDIQSIKIIL